MFDTVYAHAMSVKLTTIYIFLPSPLFPFPSFRVNWGDGTKMNWSAKTENPQSYSFTYTYSKAKSHKIQLAFFKTHSHYGAGLHPSVDVY